MSGRLRKISLIICIAVILIELLPFSTTLYFAAPEGESVKQSFSYFSHIPWGYASFGPLLTAILSCVSFVFAVMSFLGRDGAPFDRVRFTVALLCVMTSVIGIFNMNIFGWLITVLLVANGIICGKAALKK